MMETTQRVHFAGIACVIGGLAWAMMLGGLAILGSTVTPTSTLFAVYQVGWIVVQVLLLIGVLGLAWSGAAGRGWLGTLALGIALLGRTLFVLAEAHLLLIASDFSPLLPLGALVSAVGTTLVGIAVLRTGRWQGWQRFAPLLAGLYPFFMMFPFLAINGDVSNTLIGGWGLFWALLGVALMQQARAPQLTNTGRQPFERGTTPLDA